MKKVVIIFTVAFMAIGALSAQGWGPRNVPESVKIDGTLQLHKGQFAVANENNIYYVPMIGRYVGFIDNLKEGSNVSFEGYVSGNFLRPVKMTIGGKSYDLGFIKRNDRDRKERGLNDRGFNEFDPGNCCGPYSGKGRGRR